MLDQSIKTLFLDIIEGNKEDVNNFKIIGTFRNKI